MNKLRKPEDVFIKGKRLSDIISDNEIFIKEPMPYGRCMISGEDLSYIDFSDLNLSFAYLTNCNFTGSLFNKTKLKSTKLSQSNFTNARFIDSDLENAIAFNVKVDQAEFYNTNIYNVDFAGTNTDNCNFLNNYPLECPAEGSFIGWKVCRTVTESVKNPRIKDQYIVKLEIPEDAKRLSGTTRICKCDKAKVLGIYLYQKGKPINMDNVVTGDLHLCMEEVDSIHAASFIDDDIVFTTYTVGKYVFPDSFDEDRWKDYSHGIHFYMSLPNLIMAYY